MNESERVEATRKAITALNEAVAAMRAIDCHATANTIEDQARTLEATIRPNKYRVTVRAKVYAIRSVVVLAKDERQAKRIAKDVVEVGDERVREVVRLYDWEVDVGDEQADDMEVLDVSLCAPPEPAVESKPKSADACPFCASRNTCDHDPPNGHECHDCGKEWTSVECPTPPAEEITG